MYVCSVAAITPVGSCSIHVVSGCAPLGVCGTRLQRLLAFYFQKKLANEEKAVVKSSSDEVDAPPTASAAPHTARSAGDQEQKYVSVLFVAAARSACNPPGHVAGRRCGQLPGRTGTSCR